MAGGVGLGMSMAMKSVWPVFIALTGVMFAFIARRTLQTPKVKTGKLVVTPEGVEVGGQLLVRRSQIKTAHVVPGEHRGTLGTALRIERGFGLSPIDIGVDSSDVARG